MSIQIVKATDPMHVKRVVAAILGHPGTGKSSLSQSADRPLTLDADGGLYRAVNRKDSVAVTSWAGVAEMTQADLEPYETIVVDTVGRLLDKLAVQVIADDPKNRRSSGDLSLQGWGALKSAFRRWLAQLKSWDKDVVLLAHAAEEKEGDAVVIRADIQGGSYDEVMKDADLLGFLSIIGKARRLDFNPTEKYHGKNPAGWLPFDVPPAEKATTFLADIIGKAKEHFAAQATASAEAAEAVNTRVLALATETRPEALSLLAREAPTLAPIVYAQVRKAIAERAKALGFIYDMKTKAFYDPKAKQSQPAEETTV